MTAERSQRKIRDALICYAAENEAGMPSLTKQIGVEIKPSSGSPTGPRG